MNNLIYLFTTLLIRRGNYLVVTAILLLTACGFHLRGSEALHFTFLYLHQEAAAPLAQEVKRRLEERGIYFVPMPTLAQAVLSLSNERLDRRVLTVSSISGKMEEIELNYRVDMEVRNPDETPLLTPQPINLLRDYVFDETAVLAVGTEEEVLREEMFRDMVAQIMRRLELLQLEKLEVSELIFQGLKPKYAKGEQLTLDLVETVQKRNTSVDIWLVLQTGEQFLFITQNLPENADAVNNWQILSQPKPWQTNIAVEKTRHRLLDFTLPANVGGTYTLLAFYTQTGMQVDWNNLLPSIRSNFAEGNVLLVPS